MKQITIYLGSLLVLLAALCACTKPRIKMNMSAWGNKSSVNNVQLFKLETRDGIKLEEFYVDSTTLTGTRQVIVSNGTAVINETAHTATVKLKAGESFSAIGLLIYHNGTKVVPLNGSPRAGITENLSKGPYVYRVHSANGEFTDWTIIITQ